MSAFALFSPSTLKMVFYHFLPKSIISRSSQLSLTGCPTLRLQPSSLATCQVLPVTLVFSSFTTVWPDVGFSFLSVCWFVHGVCMCVLADAHMSRCAWRGQRPISSVVFAFHAVGGRVSLCCVSKSKWPALFWGFSHLYHPSCWRRAGMTETLQGPELGPSHCLANILLTKISRGPFS